ncbi:MAG: ATP-grasp domain-containing protein [Bacteroides sp.]|nr:ATP-grasp domain-containing protein [Bacteroides sp.]MCM1447378.1 ATP-grasp domain-containing protein [Bacteroides sp.]
MKRVLMVGAGIGQIFLARKIKARGHYLVTVTLPGNQPVIEIADKVCYENIFNKEGVLAIAREEKVDAVISDQNDMMMPTVAYVAEHMGLPGNSIQVVHDYCDKNACRDNCDKVGIPVPKHCSVSEVAVPESMKDVPLPWVVKPADAQSSVGVEKVNTLEEYYTAIKVAIEVSKTHTAIVEEFFKGQELVAEGFIYEGKYYNIGFADRKYFALDNLFIPAQTVFPSLVPQNVLDSIRECEEKMATLVNPQFAIVHSEYLYNAESGEYRVVESALRGGGVYISSHLVPAYSGIDINETLIDALLGEPIDIDTVLAKRNNQASGYVCFYLPEGKVQKAEGIEKINAMPSVMQTFLDELVEGMETHKLTHKGQRMGPILVKAESREALETEISIIQRTLKDAVINAKGEIKGIIWK